MNNCENEKIADWKKAYWGMVRIALYSSITFGATGYALGYYKANKIEIVSNKNSIPELKSLDSIETTKSKEILVIQ